MKKRFNWTELLDQIHRRNVIPVIGQGLYWVLNNVNQEVLLYQHLAEQLIGFPPPSTTNHSFSRAVFQFLTKNPNDYLGLKRFLTENFASLSPISCGPLWKISRIKPFSLFINTTYDHFLEHTLDSIRPYPTEVLHHTYKEKQTNRVTYEQIEKLENSYSSLIFHIYGSTSINQPPSYTETDILETLVTFQNDMELEPRNLFFKTLREKSLLFICCSYDDMLFRFFIRAITNKPYETPDKSIKRFIVDDFNSFNGDELAFFFESFNFEVFSPNGSNDFVTTLFDKMTEKYPEDIIPEVKLPVPDTYKTPETAFISFHGDNREYAVRLSSNLQEDGISVWLDQSEFEPGDEVDETIITAIDKCPVFIPIISEEARQINDEKGIKYHIREWERAYSQNVGKKNPQIIMPVKIDNTKWIYEPFKDKFFIHIPNGNREKDYDKLKNRLLKIQKGNTR